MDIPQPTQWSMTPEELGGVLEFLRAAERLKCVTRNAWTTEGAKESVAAHTWRVALMVAAFADELPGVNLSRLLQMIIVHDLGEAIGGDIPAPLQEGMPGKAEQERRDLMTLLAPLPPEVGRRIADLWDEYEAAQTTEARLAKAFDKLETIMQHNQGRNPPDFDFGYNLKYGDAYTRSPELIAAIRAILDRETRERIER